MTVTYTEQYRPVSDSETSTNDGLSVRAVRDLERGLNNYQRYQGLTKVIGQCCLPHWQTEDTTDVAENLLVPPFPPFVVPDAADSLSVHLGCYQTATAGNRVTFRLYATTGLYRVSGIVMDTTALVYGYTSQSFVCNTAAGVANHTIVHGQLSIPKTLQGTGHVPVVYLVLTSQNDAGGERAAVTTIDVTPEHT